MERPSLRLQRVSLGMNASRQEGTCRMYVKRASRRVIRTQGDEDTVKGEEEEKA